MKLFLLFVFMIILGSCQNEANFRITNNSSDKINNLYITTSNDLTSTGKYESLKKGETINYVIDMSGLPKIDGDYILNYSKSPEIIKSLRFGYFTSGSALEDLIEIAIEDDTIVINELRHPNNLY